MYGDVGGTPHGCLGRWEEKGISRRRKKWEDIKGEEIRGEERRLKGRRTEGRRERGGKKREERPSRPEYALQMPTLGDLL